MGGAGAGPAAALLCGWGRGKLHCLAWPAAGLLATEQCTQWALVCNTPRATHTGKLTPEAIFRLLEQRVTRGSALWL